MLSRHLSAQLLDAAGCPLGPVRQLGRQAVRSMGWKTRATSPSRASQRPSNDSRRERDSSSSGRGVGAERSSYRDGSGAERSSSYRGGSSYRSSSSAERSSGAERSSYRGGGSGGRGRGRDAGGQQWQQQRQQQPYRQRRQEPSAAAAADGADDSWDSYDNQDDDDDGEFLYPARPSKASYREQLFGEPLYGVAPILAALRAGSRRPHVLLMQEGLSSNQRKDARALQDISRLAEAAGVAVRSVSKHELNMLSGNRPHQGLVLDASALEWLQLDVLPAPEDLQQQQEQQLAGEQQQGEQGEQQAEAAQQGAVKHPVWLALDEVMDPQNLGAMLRSAYCLGASGVLACSRNCSPLSPVVSKASAGAAELLQLHSCRSMPRTLADAASKGWAVVGAAAESGAVPVSEFKVDRPTVLVMGNEGYGLRATVKRCCTQLVQIEMAAVAAAGGSGKDRQLVDSLNVSVATGILLHQLLTAARQ